MYTLRVFAAMPSLTTVAASHTKHLHPAMKDFGPFDNRGWAPMQKSGCGMVHFDGKEGSMTMKSLLHAQEILAPFSSCKKSSGLRRCNWKN